MQGLLRKMPNIETNGDTGRKTRSSLDVEQLRCIKSPYSEFFWLAFSRIRTRKTPNTDTFKAVLSL